MEWRQAHHDHKVTHSLPPSLPLLTGHGCKEHLHVTFVKVQHNLFESFHSNRIQKPNRSTVNDDSVDSGGGGRDGGRERGGREGGRGEGGNGEKDGKDIRLEHAHNERKQVKEREKKEGGREGGRERGSEGERGEGERIKYVHVDSGLNCNLRIVPSILHSSATRDPVAQW